MLFPLVGVVRRAVEQELVVAVLAAVHRPVGQRAVVERTQVDRLRVVVDAGDEDRERHRAARLQRQLGDARLVDDGAAVRLARLEQRRFRRHVDALGHAADAELRIDDGDLADFEPHVGAVVLLEPAHLDGHAVQTGTEERDGVVALLVRRGRRHFAGFLVADGDRGARQRGLARIEHLSLHGGPEFLRGEAAGERQHQRRTQQAVVRLHSHHSVFLRARIQT